MADKYDLRRHMRFGVVVEGARWDEDEEHWVVRLAGGERLRAAYLITATGFLSQPRLPDIEGVHDFAGEVIHTAKWDDAADLDGKRVAVIGTGATAVQLIPEIAEAAAAPDRLPAHADLGDPEDRLPDPEALQRLFARRPWTQRVARTANTALARGDDGGRRCCTTGRRGSSTGRRPRARKRHLRKQVADPELRRKLTPDYSFGCKRPTFSNDYFPTFTRDHVDLETTSIERITPTGIVTTDGRETEIDTLVLATGFNLWDANFPAIEVIGRDGRNLGKWWREHGFQAYEGVTVPQLPELRHPDLAVQLLRAVATS